MRLHEKILNDESIDTCTDKKPHDDMINRQLIILLGLRHDKGVIEIDPACCIDDQKKIGSPRR